MIRFRNRYSILHQVDQVVEKVQLHRFILDFKIFDSGLINLVKNIVGILKLLTYYKSRSLWICAILSSFFLQLKFELLEKLKGKINSENTLITSSVTLKFCGKNEVPPASDSNVLPILIHSCPEDFSTLDYFNVCECLIFLWFEYQFTKSEFK